MGIEQRSTEQRGSLEVGDMIGLAVLAIVIAAIGYGFFWVAGQINADAKRCEARLEKCGLYAGDRVTAVLDGVPGMVTGASCGQVSVRFSASAARTDTHVLGRDGVITREPYSELWMGCYEVARQ